MTATTTATGTDPVAHEQNGTNGKREKSALTAIEAITKVSKILDQLSASDRRRVLAFFSETGV